MNTKTTESTLSVSKKQRDPLFVFKVIINYLKKNWEGLLYVMPVILGIDFFTVVPMVSSMYDSFFKYDGITDREWNDFKNYIKPFTTEWETFGKSLFICDKALSISFA